MDYIISWLELSFAIGFAWVAACYLNDVLFCQ